MVNKVFRYLNCFLLLFVIYLYINSSVFALENLTSEEKTIMQAANSLGKISFSSQDIIYNDQVMGLIILKKKLGAFQKEIFNLSGYTKNFQFDKLTNEKFNKFIEHADSSFESDRYQPKEMKQVVSLYPGLFESYRRNLEKLYGPKYTWLFDAIYLSSFTNESLSSEYKNKPLLNNYNYLLDYIPYDVPDTVKNSLKSIVSLKENSLMVSKISQVKESSVNLIKYFADPENYQELYNLADLVGTWQGRLSDPRGDNHKAVLVVKSDMTGFLDVDGMFKNMPLGTLILTQKYLSFDVKPFGRNDLAIKFSGKIIDDMISGQAVDLTGKKGLWQVVKTKQEESNIVATSVVPHNPSMFTKLVGVWKGKILEENGAISNSTLFINLVDASYMLVENDGYHRSLEIKNIAVNDQAIKFTLQPKNELEERIDFVGKIIGNSIEGNASSGDGNRAYWKLLRASEGPSFQAEKLKLQQSSYLFESWCDPVLSDKIIYDNILVSYNPLNIIEYQGYVFFDDIKKSKLRLLISNYETKVLLSELTGETVLSLDVKDLHITPDRISFSANMKDRPDTNVSFTGVVKGKYMSGDLVNSFGQKLRWELIADTLDDVTLKGVKSTNIRDYFGKWNGRAKTFSLFDLPIEFDLNEVQSQVKIGDAGNLKVENAGIFNNMLIFDAYDAYQNKLAFSFQGRLLDGKLKGKMISDDGVDLTVELNHEDSTQLKRKPVQELNGNYNLESYLTDKYTPVKVDAIEKVQPEVARNYFKKSSKSKITSNLYSALGSKQKPKNKEVQVFQSLHNREEDKNQIHKMDKATLEHHLYRKYGSSEDESIAKESYSSGKGLKKVSEKVVYKPSKLNQQLNTYLSSKRSDNNNSEEILEDKKKELDINNLSKEELETYLVKKYGVSEDQSVSLQDKYSTTVQKPVEKPAQVQIVEKVELGDKSTPELNPYIDINSLSKEELDNYLIQKYGTPSDTKVSLVDKYSSSPKMQVKESVKKTDTKVQESAKEKVVDVDIDKLSREEIQAYLIAKYGEPDDISISLEEKYSEIKEEPVPSPKKTEILLASKPKLRPKKEVADFPEVRSVHDVFEDDMDVNSLSDKVLDNYYADKYGEADQANESLVDKYKETKKEKVAVLQKQKSEKAVEKTTSVEKCIQKPAQTKIDQYKGAFEQYLKDKYGIEVEGSKMPLEQKYETSAPSKVKKIALAQPKIEQEPEKLVKIEQKITDEDLTDKYGTSEKNNIPLEQKYKISEPSKVKKIALVEPEVIKEPKKVVNVQPKKTNESLSDKYGTPEKTNIPLETKYQGSFEEFVGNGLTKQQIQNLTGKWVGELTNPYRQKGEIILDIKSDTGYLYVDKMGEKVPFKLFDFKMDGKNISFQIKPSASVEYGIRFEGVLIQGVISGTATDPGGEKGKWHVQKI